MKSLLKKYFNMSVVAKASIWFLFCTIIQKTLALITTPIFTRIMSSEQYGIYSTYLSITAILTVVLTLNFDTCAYMNGIAKMKTDEEKDKLASSLLLLTTIITVSFSFLVILFRRTISNWLGIPSNLIIVMLVEILFIPPVKFWMVKQRFSYKYISLVIVTLGMLLLNNIIGIIFVLNAENNQAFYRVLSIALIQMLFGIFFLVKYFKKSGMQEITKYWKYGLRLNIPLIPHGLSLIILSSSDRIMINSMVGSIEAGIYGVAYSAGQIINAIKLSFVDSIRPWIYEKLKQKDYKKIKQNCKVMLLVNIFLTFIIVGLAPEIIFVLAGKKYYNAIYIIPPVAVSSYFTFIYNICAIVEIYYEKNKRVMIASVIAAMTNLILNYLLIPYFGYLVAGYTTLIAYIILCILHFGFLNRICKKEMDNNRIMDVKSIIIMSIFVIIGMIIFTILYSYIIMRYLVVLIMIIGCYLSRKKIMNLMKELRKTKKKV